MIRTISKNARPTPFPVAELQSRPPFPGSDDGVYSRPPDRLDREKSERSAGLRTFPLVAIAACGFVQAAETVIAGNPEATARVVEGLITGMGFVGGGAILVVKNSVRGTATAASLWATGAVGTAVGLGAYDIALVLSVATFLTLRIMTSLKSDDRPEDMIDKD